MGRRKKDTVWQTCYYCRETKPTTKFKEIELTYVPKCNKCADRAKNESNKKPN